MSDTPADDVADAPTEPDTIMVSGIDIDPGFATVTSEDGTETLYPSLRFRFYGQDGDDKRWGVPPITLILDPEGMRQLARMIPQSVRSAILAAHDGPNPPGLTIRTVPATNRTGARTRKKHRR